MTDHEVVIYLAGLLIGLFVAGAVRNDDHKGLIILASVFWPFIILGIVFGLPFFLVYNLGRVVANAIRQQP